MNNIPSSIGTTRTEISLHCPHGSATDNDRPHKNIHDLVYRTLPTLIHCPPLIKLAARVKLPLLTRHTATAQNDLKTPLSCQSERHHDSPEWASQLFHTCSVARWRELITQGANPKSVHQSTPFIHFVLEHKGYDFALELIQGHLVDPTVLSADGKTILEVALESNTNLFWQLIDIGKVSPNLTNERGDTILHALCSNGESEAVQALIELGGDPNIRDHDGNTLTYLSLEKARNIELCLRLLDWGADINAPHIDGGVKTLLGYGQSLFTKNRKSILLRELLQRGIAPPKGAENHLEVLRVVCNNPSWFQQRHVLERLIAAGWDVNARAPNGETLLYLATIYQNWTLFRKLVELGASPDTRAGKEDLLVSYKQLHDNPKFWEDCIGCANFYKKEIRGLDNKIIRWLSPDSTTALICSILTFCKKNNTNPLALIFFFGDAYLIQKLSTLLPFKDFCDALAQMKHQYPHLQIDWILNALFEVAPEHYSRFKEVEPGLDDLPPLEESVDLAQLEELFSEVNFSNPGLPFYKGSYHRTFDGKVYSVDELTSGIGKIVGTITQRIPNVAAPSLLDAPKTFEAYYTKLERYLSHVILHLQDKNVDQATKNSVLIDLAYAGQQCTEKWKEVFYQAYCRLSENRENIFTLDEEVMKTLGENRSDIVTHLATENTHIDIIYELHAYRAILFALQNARAIPGEKQLEADKFVEPDTKVALESFDKIYRPHHLIAHLVDRQCASSDFRLKLQDWFPDNLAPLWLDEPFRQIITHARECGPDQMIDTKEKFAKFFDKLFPEEPFTGPGTLENLINQIRRQTMRYFTTSFDEHTDDFLMPSKINPLAVGHMLVQLGYLKYRDALSFAKSFEKIAPLL